MSSITEHTGYSKLDAEFKAKEAEQLIAIRKELDHKRAAAKAQATKSAHWMICPKCGGTMAEKRLENVLVDECTACKGLYFDAGEIGLLLRHEKASSGVFGRLFSR